MQETTVLGRALELLRVPPDKATKARMAELTVEEFAEVGIVVAAIMYEGNPVEANMGHLTIEEFARVGLVIAAELYGQL